MSPSRRFTCFGSDCLVHLTDESSAVAVERSLDWAVAWCEGEHRRLTRFVPGSELSRFNAGAGTWCAVSPTLEALLRAALDAYAASSGLVHAGVLRALERAGYDRPFDGTHRVRRIAPGNSAAPLAPLPELLDVRRGRARLAPRAAIDLGGIAKGWLADRLADRLGNAVVDLGGDVRAAGSGPDGTGWPVGVGDTTVLLSDMGAATSGTWRRRWNGGHHLIDPRTGLPSATDLVEVSAIAATAFDAEVLAKTALLAGSAGAEAALAGRALGWRAA